MTKYSHYPLTCASDEGATHSESSQEENGQEQPKSLNHRLTGSQHQGIEGRGGGWHAKECARFYRAMRTEGKVGAAYLFSYYKVYL